MVELSDTDVREMLERRAADFATGPVAADAILGRARRRKVRHFVLVSATATFAVVALVGGISVSLLGGSERGADSAAGGSPATPTAPGQLRLVDYSVRAPARDHPDAGSGPTITLHDLRKHAKCMRS